MPQKSNSIARVCPENMVGGCSEKDANFHENLKTSTKMLPPETLQRRVLFAIVASSYSSASLKHISDSVIEPLKRQGRWFNCLKDGLFLDFDIWYLASYDKLAIQRHLLCLEWIKRTANIMGFQNCVVGWLKGRVPKACSKEWFGVKASRLHRDYRERVDCIGNFSFKKIAKALSSHEHKAK